MTDTGGTEADLDTLWRELGFTPGAKPDALGRLLSLIRQTARMTTRDEIARIGTSYERATELVEAVRRANAEGRPLRLNEVRPSHSSPMSPVTNSGEGKETKVFP